MVNDVPYFTLCRVDGGLVHGVLRGGLPARLSPQENPHQQLRQTFALCSEAPRLLRQQSPKPRIEIQDFTPVRPPHETWRRAEEGGIG